MGRNLTSVAHAGATTWQRDFTVDERSDRAVPSGMLTGQGTPADFYDGDGNLTAYETLGELAWDYRNALASVLISPGGTKTRETYLYNAAGTRLRKVLEAADGTPIASRTYVGNLILFAGAPAEGAQAQTVVRLAADKDTLVAVATAQRPDTPSVRYQYANNVNSVVLELDGAGELVSYEEFYPYGESALGTGPVPAWLATKIYRYGGKEHDDATAFAYYGDRYYVGSFGRRPSTDPAGPDGSDLDLYEFVRNNQISTIDLHGWMPSKTRKPKKKFNVKIVQRKAAMGLKLSVDGRPKKFTTYTLKALSKSFPNFHVKGTTRLVGNNKYSRNHEKAWFTVSKYIRTQTRGLTISEMEDHIRTVDTSTFKQVRYRNQLSKIQKTSSTLSKTTIEKAFGLVLLEHYNDPSNLYIGLSSANSSGGSSMKQSHTKLKNSHNGTAPLPPGQVTSVQQKFQSSGVDVRPGAPPTHSQQVTDHFKFAFGRTPGKYII